MNNVTRYASLRASALALCVPLALTACSGGGGGDDANIGFGDGQSPDPTVIDFPIAYVKRPVPVDDNGDPVQEDARELLRFNVGADLFFRDRASPSTPDVNLTADITQGLGDIRDVEVASDGSRVAFAMRAQFIEGADEEDQPTWNIWEYDVAADTLRRVIPSDIIAEAGHDIGPHYLPDGRIVFASTRQRRSAAILLDEGKPQFAAQDEDRNEPAFVLHVMNPDGSEIDQISYNQSHDLDPVVLSNGQILFSRWDNMGNTSEINLYRMNPDGSGLELLYGANSHDTGLNGEEVHFLQPRELPDGRVLAVVKPFDAPGGDLFEIDTLQYVENTQPLKDDIGVLTGPAQKPGTINDVVTAADAISPGGRYASAFPLFDGTGRLLVSWTQCRLEIDMRIVACTDDNLANPLAVEAQPLYGIWIYDPAEQTQMPVVVPEEGFVFDEIVAAEPRANAPVVLDGAEAFTLDSDLESEGAGVIHIRSVYDIDGNDVSGVGIATLADPAQTTAAERPARFLRVVKAVSMPDDEVRDFDNSAFGVSQQQLMREIVGYAMVEPDGSVMMKVPANVALAVSVLDENGRRIGPRHTNWLQVRPGQKLECNGCHDPTSGLSHGRRDAFAAVNQGATTTGQPFPNTDPALFADVGETMAEVRARISCGGDNCAALEPSTDVEFKDVWTDEAAAGRARDALFAYKYSDLSTPAPTIQACVDTTVPSDDPMVPSDSSWSATCRIVIHYETHVHPLWSVPRLVIDPADMVTVLEDNTCIACHTPVDAANAAKVPDGQLDLTDGASDIDADHFKAYRELLSADNEQEVVNGALQDRLVQVGVDPVTGDPILQPVTVPPSMSPAGALASARFFSRFAPGGTHEDRLTTAELKLLSEWLDIGAQYYNDPFTAPEN